MTTIWVTSTADSGTGSLREAIANASSGDAIRFDAALANSTITLTSGELLVEVGSIDIDGVDAANLVVSGNNASRVFHFGAGLGQCRLANLDIANGYGPDHRGGALKVDHNTTDLLLEDCILRDSYGNMGGAAQFADAGTIRRCQFLNNEGNVGGAIVSGFECILNVYDTTFDGNMSYGRAQLIQEPDVTNWVDKGHCAGAIYCRSDGTLLVENCTFRNNEGINGGAINGVHVGMIVRDSLFENNSAIDDGSPEQTRGYGGGIYTDGASKKIDGTPVGGNIEVYRCKFKNNSAMGQGAGSFLFAYQPENVIVEDCEFNSNILTTNSFGDSFGGGLRVGGGNLTLTRSLFNANTCENKGGGLYTGDRTPATIENCTFTANRAESADGNSGNAGGFMDTSDAGYAVHLLHCTFADNHCGWSGGAFSGSVDDLTLTNCLFSNNTANNGGNGWNVEQHCTSPAGTDGGGNIQYPDKHPTNSNDVYVCASPTVADPLLEALADNGGLVRTRAIPHNSPARDLGVSTSATLDGRSYPRYDTADSGAYEFHVTAKTILIRRSSTSPTPATLQYGEPAYSTNSDTLFVGASDGFPVAIGGSGWLESNTLSTSTTPLSDLSAATGDVDFGGNKGINVGDPTAAQDLMSKSYGDSTYLSQSGGTLTGDLAINGNLNVTGDTFSAESATVEIGDNTLRLNSDVTGTPSENSGFSVERGTDANVSLVWDEVGDFWSLDGQFLANLADPTSGGHLADRDYNDGRYIQQAALTAVGGILYGETGGAVTELAGNTETTKKFLTQVGDGTSSAAPGWGVLVADDLPILPSEKGGTGQLTLGPLGTMAFFDGSSSYPLLIGDAAQLMVSSGAVPDWQSSVDCGTF